MNEPLKFFSLQPSSPFTDTVAKWIYEEWSGEEGDSIELIKEKLAQKIEGPTSQVAIYNKELVGFVWIIRNQQPPMSRPHLWINGLYVVEAHRGKGFGQQLVRRAEELSAPFEDKLFAYTDIPAFYQKLNWTIHTPRNDQNHTVVVQLLP